MSPARVLQQLIQSRDNTPAFVTFSTSFHVGTKLSHSGGFITLSVSCPLCMHVRLSEIHRRHRHHLYCLRSHYLSTYTIYNRPHTKLHACQGQSHHVAVSTHHLTATQFYDTFVSRRRLQLEFARMSTCGEFYRCMDVTLAIIALMLLFKAPSPFTSLSSLVSTPSIISSCRCL